MANPIQLKRLRRGTKVWNKWREDNLIKEIDLSEAKLSRAKLSEANLYNANLR
jgi:uncharacterized protein YjbI with pentapeptide repeats